MVVNKGESISLLLQLIKSDGISVEDEASISFQIFDASGTVEFVPSTIAIYNENVQGYVYQLDPSTEWTNQDVGSYIIVWTVADTDDDFNSKYVEDLQINIDKTLIDKILGLVHQNMVIDQTQFDAWDNLESARVRIFMDSAKTQLLATYQITADTDAPGKFVSWEQVEV